MCVLSIGETPKCKFVDKTIYIRFPYALIFFFARKSITLRVIDSMNNPYCGVYGLGLIQICEGGATVIQLREKNRNTREFLEDAKAVREITSKFGIPFIVNDRVDLAIASKSDGVHLGETDMPVEYARKILGNRVIGKSVNGVSQAIEAVQKGATYIAFGCLFPSSTKSKPLASLSLIAEIKKAVSVPVLGIGGITLEKIENVLSTGADGICVAGDLFNHSNLKERTQEFKLKIQRIERECVL